MSTDQNANPYSSPNAGADDTPSDLIPHRFSNASRIGAGIASVVVFLFAFAAYIAWAIADFYSNADQTHFRAVLGTAIGLGIIAAFWMFFAIIGHRLIPRTGNLIALGITGIVLIPACIFVLRFFM
jgi:hypothetical protein